ncbi:MAG: hypothetical protein KJ072_15400 [Verrucomicrobia bacterium]|nr:hypothetical protein [Verrucomicrobiota bacterium]
MEKRISSLGWLHTTPLLCTNGKNSRTLQDSFNNLCNRVAADQATVTLGNSDGEIGSLTISDPPTQAEVQVLRDKCDELADDVRALSALVQPSFANSPSRP